MSVVGCPMVWTRLPQPIHRLFHLACGSLCLQRLGATSNTRRGDWVRWEHGCLAEMGHREGAVAHCRTGTGAALGVTPAPTPCSAKPTPASLSASGASPQPSLHHDKGQACTRLASLSSLEVNAPHRLEAEGFTSEPTGRVSGHH